MNIVSDAALGHAITESHPPRTPPWTRSLLLLAAALQAYERRSSLPILLGDMPEVPGPGWGGWRMAATIALHPILALVALILALRLDLRGATLAMAGLVLWGWLSSLPSVVLHGLDPGLRPPRLRRLRARARDGLRGGSAGLDRGSARPRRRPCKRADLRGAPLRDRLCGRVTRHGF